MLVLRSSGRFLRCQLRAHAASIDMSFHAVALHVLECCFTAVASILFGAFSATAIILTSWVLGVRFLADSIMRPPFNPFPRRPVQAPRRPLGGPALLALSPPLAISLAWGPTAQGGRRPRPPCGPWSPPATKDSSPVPGCFGVRKQCREANRDLNPSGQFISGGSEFDVSLTVFWPFHPLSLEGLLKPFGTGARRSMPPRSTFGRTVYAVAYSGKVATDRKTFEGFGISRHASAGPSVDAQSTASLNSGCPCAGSDLGLEAAPLSSGGPC